MPTLFSIEKKMGHFCSFATETNNAKFQKLVDTIHFFFFDIVAIKTFYIIIKSNYNIISYFLEKKY